MRQGVVARRSLKGAWSKAAGSKAICNSMFRCPIRMSKSCYSHCPLFGIRQLSDYCAAMTVWVEPLSSGHSWHDIDLPK